MNIYPVAGRSELKQAKRSATAAAAVYMLSEDMVLFKASDADTRGCVLVIDCTAVKSGNAGAAAYDIMREHDDASAAGILFELPDTPCPPLNAALCEAAKRVPVFIREGAPFSVPGAVTLISGARHEGNFRSAVETSVRERPTGVDLFPARFGLSPPDGVSILSLPDIEDAMHRYCAVPVYSDALCAEYFSYIKDGRTHAVIFDTAETLRRKAMISEEAGAVSAFIPWRLFSKLTYRA